ncbi:MAG: phosphonate ABC transporter, permease protein PhnE [Candidatus Thermoplasmatota archaeon]|nr:phosphonate ABC transporter, permease protein PhnE [Candidatus Thermoplasmatota archaeon]
MKFWQHLKKRPRLLIYAGIFILAFMVSNKLGITVDNLGNAWENAGILWSEMFPPDFSVVTERASWSQTECTWSADWACSAGIHGLSETIEIAFLATLFGMLLSLPLSMMAAHNLSPIWLSLITRNFLAGLRVLPSLVWALIFVIMFGPGPLAGVLAMTLYTVGYLGKLQYEALEGVSRHPLEAARAMGLPRWQVARYFALPEASNSILSQILFMFEYNIRHGSVIGLVGAGGIGWYLNNYLGIFSRYDRALALIIVIYVAVVIIDQISLSIRHRFMDSETHAPRARWREIIPFFSKREV